MVTGRASVTRDALTAYLAGKGFIKTYGVLSLSGDLFSTSDSSENLFMTPLLGVIV